MIHFWVALFATGSALVSGTCIGLMVGRIGLWRERAERERYEQLWLESAKNHTPAPAVDSATFGEVGDLDDVLPISGGGFDQTATILEFPVDRTTTTLGDTTSDDLLGTVELPPVAGDGGGEPAPRRRVGAFASPRWMPPKHRSRANAQDSPGRGSGQ